MQQMERLGILNWMAPLFDGPLICYGSFRALVFPKYFNFFFRDFKILNVKAANIVLIHNSRKEIPLKLEAYLLTVLHCELNSCVNPKYTKPSSSTLFTKLGSSEDPMVFFVISQLFDAVDYSNYVFWVSETIIQWFKLC